MTPVLCRHPHPDLADARPPRPHGRGKKMGQLSEEPWIKAQGRRGANYAKGSAGAGASSAGEASLGFVEVSADLDLGLEPFGFLSM